jgi:plasmid stabilization system protein ParE
MKFFRVEYALQSRRDIRSILRYIARKSSINIAENYVESIRIFCDGLSTSPHRGTERPNLKRGIRVIGFRRRVTIYFRVSNASQIVTIARILYAGRTDRSKK